MPVEMIDRDEREPSCPGDRLRGGDADEQGADQTGAGGHADEPHVVEPDPCLLQRIAHDGRDQLEVAARRDLRHDAAVTRVQVGLRGDDVGEDVAVRCDDGRGGLVAGGLEAEDHGASRSGRITPSRRPEPAPGPST